jgi:hypothetical protein
MVGAFAPPRQAGGGVGNGFPPGATCVNDPGMKRSVLLVLLLAFATSLLAPFAFAAASKASPAPVPADKSPVAPFAAAISTITGIAISPLLGTGAFGAYKWFTAKDDAARAALPWYAQLKYWLPMLLVVGVCAAKDAFGAAVPAALKKPFDIVEAVENKMSGVVAAGAVVPFTVSTFMDILVHPVSHTAGPLLTPSGLAAIQIGAIDGASILTALALPGALAVFAVVWMASHAINVLILLSPWGAIDAALKGARTGLLGLVTITAALNPWAGAALSIVVILVAYLIAGWAFRLTIFGTVFCWDFFTMRAGRFSPRENDNAMFAGAHLPGVPVRTYGRLVQRTEGGLEFSYRPWPWMPIRSAKVGTPAAELTVGRGLFFSEISNRDDRTFFLLPPRYRGHEETLARAYLLSGVKPAGLRKAWGELRDLFGGRTAAPANA